MPRAFAWGFPSKETMAGYINRFSQICARLTGIIVIVLAICLIGSLLISIFFRYVIGQALSWPEEISLILFTWLVLLAGSLGVRQDFHVRLTIVVSRFPTPVQHILDRLVVLAIGIFGAILLYSGYDLVKRTAEHLTPTLRLPLDWLNYSAPVCGTLILLHAVSKLLTEREES
jgi:TRAP-type C4-dicarboxylate transport system permease small subunit